MPPRWLALSFVAFWIAMTGLFLWREVLPRLNPTEPLMFPVELVDEAGTIRNQNLYDVGWEVTKNGTGGYVANVEWNYIPESDSFDSHCILVRGTNVEKEKPRALGPVAFPQFHNVSMDSHCFMTRSGQMHALSVKSEFGLSVRLPEGDDAEVSRSSVVVEGKPDARHFVPHLSISSTPANAREPLPEVNETGSAVEVGERNVVLNPLHPVRRFPTLKDDQHWPITLIDPFALGALPRSLGPDRVSETLAGTYPSAFVLEARVERERQVLDWVDKKKIECRIIRCGDEGSVMALTLWVAVEDGLVMKQEVSLNGDSWVLERRSHPNSRIPPKFTPKLP
jgi:hypothetical protein